MKTRLLLVYGYILPFASSALVSALPWLFGYDYKNISNYFLQNLELLLAFLAVVGAITFPFQTSIINEDNPHVLAVLKKSKAREVFVRASIFQAILVLCAAFLILFLSSIPNPSSLTGFIELLASAIITFESIALISNGRSYSSIREKIIMAVSEAEQKKSQKR